MEDDKFGFSYEEEVKHAVQKFERMKKIMKIISSMLLNLRQLLIIILRAITQ